MCAFAAKKDQNTLSPSCRHKAALTIKSMWRMGSTHIPGWTGPSCHRRLLLTGEIFFFFFLNLETLEKTIRLVWGLFLFFPFCPGWRVVSMALISWTLWIADIAVIRDEVGFRTIGRATCSRTLRKGSLPINKHRHYCKAKFVFFSQGPPGKSASSPRS